MLDDDLPPICWAPPDLRHRWLTNAENLASWAAWRIAVPPPEEPFASEPAILDLGDDHDGPMCARCLESFCRACEPERLRALEAGRYEERFGFCAP